MVRRSVALQLVLVLLAASLIPLLLAGGIQLSRTEAALRTEREQGRTRLAETARIITQRYLQDARGRVLAIARMLEPEPVREDARRLAEQLKSLLLPAEEFLGLAFTDRRTLEVETIQAVQFDDVQRVQQRLSNDLGVFPSQFGLLESEDLVTGNSGRFAAGDLFSDQFVANMATSLAPVTNTLPIGIRIDGDRELLADLSLDPLSRLFAGLSHGSDREVALMDGDGKVVAASTAQRHPAWLTTRLALEAGQGDDWHLVVREDEETLLAPLRWARQRVLVQLIGTAVLALLLSLVLARWWLRPVRALTDAALAVEAGDLSARSGIERPDEIGRLSHAFDRMVAAVETLDRAKGEFVATVSHELRTPLTGMKCSVENLVDGLGGPETLPRVRDDLDRLIRLVNELLELARLDAGASLQLENVDLAQIAAGAIATLTPLATTRGVRIQSRFADSEFEVDHARMHQVFSNLLDNAIKFSPQGGTITITTDSSGFSVTDEGEGVPRERQEQIFQRFAGDGGLGLSICRKIVELHGGKIYCEGSTFRVTL